MSFGIGIPTINRVDLLKPSMDKYMLDFKNTDIHIIDNGQQGIISLTDSITIHREDKNLGVAASWNKLCKIIFEKHDWALLINDDVYLGYGEDVVNDAIYKSEVGIVQSAHNFSVLLISKKLFEEIGEFDEGFYPAYYEDSDYLYRLKLKGLRQEIDYTLDPVDVKVSQTYEKDPELVNKAMADNRQRYIDKWGGSPMLETFKSPFNDIAKKLQKLTSGKQSNWLEGAIFRRENQKWLDYSSQIARRILALKEENEKITKEYIASILGCSVKKADNILKGWQNLTLEEISKLSVALNFELIEFPDYKWMHENFNGEKIK